MGTATGRIRTGDLRFTNGRCETSPSEFAGTYSTLESGAQHQAQQTPTKPSNSDPTLAKAPTITAANMRKIALYAELDPEQ